MGYPHHGKLFSRKEGDAPVHTGRDMLTEGTRTHKATGSAAGAFVCREYGLVGTGASKATADRCRIPFGIRNVQEF